MRLIKYLICWIKTKHKAHKKTEWLDYTEYQCWQCGYKWYREKVYG